MKGTASRKIPGGKMVKVSVEYGYVLENVKITGDFFLHPEESIEDIERAVLSCHYSDSEQVFKSFVSGADLAGFSAHCKRCIKPASLNLFSITERDSVKCSQPSKCNGII